MSPRRLVTAEEKNPKMARHENEREERHVQVPVYKKNRKRRGGGARARARAKKLFFLRGINAKEGQTDGSSNSQHDS